MNHKGTKRAKGTGDLQLERAAHLAIGAAIVVHRRLGPGLLESVYRVCLRRELGRAGLSFRTEVALPVIYDGVEIAKGYRLDFLVEERVILEVKSVADLLPVHKAQLLTYLKLTGIRIGLLLNFNVAVLRQGICRLIDG
jgi:GxxExxY protein